jgi:hypothetical protein
METKSKEVVILLAVLALGLFLVYWFDDADNSKTNKNHTSNGNSALTTDDKDDEDDEDDVEDDEESSNEESSEEESSDEESGPVPSDDTLKYFPQTEPSSPEKVSRKFKSRNQAKGGSYKSSSYDVAKRGNLPQSEWSTYFDQNNTVIGKGGSDDFLPVDESGGKYATFNSKSGEVCGSNQGCSPEDLFDVDKYLPQEVNDDWFEVQPEPVSVKNRHLINITKPVGVNTIGTSMKNSSYDIRGAPSCPKSVISPFLNSSIGADQNLKPLF